MKFHDKKTGLAGLAALAVTAMLAFSPMKAEAATCSPGGCAVHGADGQNLTDVVAFSITDITNGNGGFFTFAGDFFNNTEINASASTTVLQFEPTGLASINNLLLKVVFPNAAQQQFNITDASGFPVNPTGSDVTVTLDLSGAPNQSIGFELTGNAVQGPGGINPGIQMTVAAVPLPAAGFLLLGGLGGLAALRRRKRAA